MFVTNTRKFNGKAQILVIFDNNYAAARSERKRKINLTKGHTDVPRKGSFLEKRYFDSSFYAILHDFEILLQDVPKTC